MSTFARRGLLLFAAMLCARISPAEEPEPIPAESIVDHLNQFAWDVYGELREVDANLIFSPIGLAAPLSIAADGARGTTRTQMLDGLHLTEQSDRLRESFAALQRDVLDTIADKKDRDSWTFLTSLWIDRRGGLDQSFTDSWTTSLGAELRSVDFRRPLTASKAVNAWFHRQTRGMLSQVIPPGAVTRETAFVIANATDFEKQWSHKFDPGKTSEEDFFLNETATVRHAMMFQLSRFAIQEEKDFQAIRLPYVGDSTSLIVILPRSKSGLAEVEQSLDAAAFTKIVANLMTPEEEDAGPGFFGTPRPRPRKAGAEKHANLAFTSLHFPRFKVASHGDFVNTLRNLGMANAFDKEQADFTGLAARETADPIFLSFVVQSAAIEVDEQGTRAAAATGIGGFGLGPRVTSFRADHPFLFAIVHNESKCILFLGRLIDPSR